MADQCLIAEYKSMDDAKLGLKILATDHFSSDNVSLVSRHDDDSISQLDQLQSHATGAPPTDGAVAAGALTGAGLAVPLVTSMIGPFMVAGPLVGMVTGGAVGGLLSGADKWGVDHDVAETYEQRVKAGNVLVIVSDDDSTRIDDAKALLMTSDHESIEQFRIE